MSYDEELKQLFENPLTGLIGIDKLYRKLKLIVPIRKQDVANWLKAQTAYAVHQAILQPKYYYPIKAEYENQRHQADLMDVSNMSHKNKGINFLLCVIDVFSRKAYVRPLKTKTAKNVANAYASVVIEAKPKVLTTDAGSEFISREFQKIVEANSIIHAVADVADHHKMGIVERFNKTLRNLFEKYKTVYDTQTWIDVLPQLVENYNNTYHSSIGSTPNKPNPKFIMKHYAKQEEKFFESSDGDKKFDVGDDVRFAKNRTLFSKGAEAKLTKQTYKIEQQIGNMYRLSNGKWYKVYELALAKDIPLTSDPGRTKTELHVDPEPLMTEMEKLPKPSRRFLRKEGVKLENKREGLRERKPESQLENQQYGRVIW